MSTTSRRCSRARPVGVPLSFVYTPLTHESLSCRAPQRSQRHSDAENARKGRGSRGLERKGGFTTRVTAQIREGAELLAPRAASHRLY